MPLMTKRRCLGALVTFACVAFAPSVASAFCGFYVSGADAKLFNNATQVVLMRDGTRTVLSMQNNYEGPPEAFAMVVPVPVILQKENVRTLPKEVFDKVDRLTAPRLVEYWEQDPCGMDYAMHERRAMGPMGRSAGAGAASKGMADLGVTVEAEFDVGEYEVVILSAKDSGGLDTWLKQEKYKIPDGSEPYLRPYVQSGSKFFVARVDPKRVTFEKGQAQLSPLRFHYDSQDFSLPVRLGLINSRGTQDLIVNILASQRYEPANYPSVTIPTNLDIAEGAKEHFGRFYTTLFDRTLEKHPKAIVTEYSWDASSCDPCPGPAMYPDDFALLGADALATAKDAPTTPRVNAEPAVGKATPHATQMLPKRFLSRVQMCWTAAQEKKAKPGRVEVKVSWGADGKVKEAGIAKNETGDAEVAACVKKAFDGAAMPAEDGSLTFAYALVLQPQMQWRSWTITRLHARYSKEALGEDIVFKAAPAIVGGREARDEKGTLENGAKPSGMNNFQGRYAIRHPWIGPIDCKEPRRGVWGGPWHDLKITDAQPVAAEKLAFVPRGGVTLTSFVRTDIPELDVKAGTGPLPPAAVPSGTASAGGTAWPAPSSSSAPANKGGCGGCNASASRSDAVPLVALALAALLASRRRRS